MKRKRVICAGGGLAALYFALHVSTDTEVLILAPGNYDRSNSYLAKGGVAIPFANDIEQHIEDTLIAGDGLCDRHAVTDIITQGQHMVSDLAKAGFLFDHTIGREGGHRVNRIRHVGDETGKHLTQHIAALAKAKPNIRSFTDHVVLDLLVEGGMCKGALIGNKQEHTLEWISADAVVLATGGCGNLFRYHTNSEFANGEGYALAQRAGAELSGMEFMQFHPTMLFPEAGCGNFLITEAFRGAGAKLIGVDEYDLMLGVHEMGSLAPRDIVSRTITHHLQRHQASHVWLDFEEMDRSSLEQTFPAVYRICQQNGYQNRIPVIPAAHYMCGGVKTSSMGETTVRNLYAVGEVANTGLHGANRLASNSLLELLIVSRRVATCINDMETHRFEMCENIKAENTGVETAGMVNELKHILWEHAGIVRNGETLDEGMEKLKRISNVLSGCIGNVIDIKLTQLQRRVQTAMLIVESAANRLENKGCHFRNDVISLTSANKQQRVLTMNEQ